MLPLLFQIILGKKKKSTVGMYGPHSNATGSWQSASCAVNSLMILFIPIKVNYDQILKR